VELTRSLSAHRARRLNAPAMAGSPDLETRVRALFARRDRRPLRARVAVAISALILVISLPVASLHLYAQALRGSVTGHVEDPSGARVPDCSVTAKNLDGKNLETANCNASGEYTLTSIPPGRYTVTISKPGFKMMTLPIVVTSNLVSTVNGRLDLGGVTESVTVTGRQAAAGTGPSVTATQSVRVGGAVASAMLLDGKKPQYPASLEQAGIEGLVVMRGVITKEGVITDLTVVNTVSDQAFADAALEAVGTWRYVPTKLNGDPVESETTVTVTFKLGQ
jgi:TonB family protein